MSNSTSTNLTEPTGFDEAHFSNAIKEILLKRNDLHHIQLELKTKMKDALQNQESPQVMPKPRDIVMLEKLILEYLDWFGYKYAVEAFSLESGTSLNFSRAELNRIKIDKIDKDVPILLQVIMNMMAMKNIHEEMKEYDKQQ